jgi:enoyl-CoA hydratase
VLAGGGRPEDEAMRTELAYGLNSLAIDSSDGVARFTKGAGRHGTYSPPV